MNFFSSILVFLKSIALAAIHYISIRCVGVIKIRVTNSLLSVDFPQEREETENDIFVPFTFFLLRLSLLFLSSLWDLFESILGLSVLLVSYLNYIRSVAGLGIPK